MKVLNDLKVKTKLAILVVIASISLAIVGGVGYFYLQEANSELTVMYQQRLVPTSQISKLISQMEMIVSTL